MKILTGDPSSQFRLAYVFIFVLFERLVWTALHLFQLSLSLHKILFTDLNSCHRLQGVITDDVVGRPTEIRFFYKEEESDNYVVYFPNFNLTARDPGTTSIYSTIYMFNNTQLFHIPGSFGQCFGSGSVVSGTDPDPYKTLRIRSGMPICNRVPLLVVTGADLHPNL